MDAIEALEHVATEAILLLADERIAAQKRIAHERRRALHLLDIARQLKFDRDVYRRENINLAQDVAILELENAKLRHTAAIGRPLTTARDTVSWL